MTTPNAPSVCDTDTRDRLATYIQKAARDGMLLADDQGHAVADLVLRFLEGRLDREVLDPRLAHLSLHLVDDQGLVLEAHVTAQTSWALQDLLRNMADSLGTTLEAREETRART